MFRTLVLLGIFAYASAANKLWNSGLAQKFDVNPLTWGSSSFKGLPLNQKLAENKGWVETEGPTRQTCYESLVLYVNPSELTTGLYFNENGKLAGMLIAIPVDEVTSYYDMTEQGFVLWTTSVSGTEVTLYTIALYFVSQDEESRVYDDSKVLQSDNLVYQSLNGDLDVIANNLTNIDSVWKEQNCVVLMGRHYYHNMTTSTTCDSPFPPFFGLYDTKTNQLIGVGMMLLGTCTGSTFEAPSTTAVKFIVNNGPDCLYTLVEKYGACTRHVYFVDNPLLITC